MSNYTFRVIIEPDQPHGYHAFVPLLRGLHTQGNSLEEVKQNLREAIICHLQGLLKDKKPVPVEGESLECIESISCEEVAVAT